MPQKHSRAAKKEAEIHFRILDNLQKKKRKKILKENREGMVPIVQECDRRRNELVKKGLEESSIED